MPYETLIKELYASAAKAGGNRSRMAEEAIRYWRRQSFERDLIEGYLAMAEEDLETAEAMLEHPERDI